MQLRVKGGRATLSILSGLSLFSVFLLINSAAADIQGFCYIDYGFTLASSEQAFQRALDWAAKYWRALIDFLVKLFCSALEVFDVSC